jgi:hypothetical protein
VLVSQIDIANFVKTQSKPGKERRLVDQALQWGFTSRGRGERRSARQPGAALRAM